LHAAYFLARLDCKGDGFMTAPWITFRPALKVLDCTIRDGGLINNHAFEDGFVKAVYDGCVAAGIDYMEIGYKASKKLFARDQCGDWKFCPRSVR
jgi:4-hydroxy 2-oxovalerate aldolase